MTSGYQPCACRDCFDVAIGYDDDPTLCQGCEEAGCTPCDCIDPDRGCPHGECDRDDAYGMDEEYVDSYLASLGGAL